MSAATKTAIVESWTNDQWESARRVCRQLLSAQCWDKRSMLDVWTDTKLLEDVWKQTGARYWAGAAYWTRWTVHRKRNYRQVLSQAGNNLWGCHPSSGWHGLWLVTCFERERHVSDYGAAAQTRKLQCSQLETTKYGTERCRKGAYRACWRSWQPEVALCTTPIEWDSPRPSLQCPQIPRDIV